MEDNTKRADKLLARVPSLRARMKRADPNLYADCKETETNLIEEFTMEYFSEFMNRVTLRLNGEEEKVPVPIPSTTKILQNIPEEGLVVNNESFKKDEIFDLIRVSQWRFARS